MPATADKKTNQFPDEMAYLTRRQQAGLAKADPETIVWVVSGRTDDRLVINEFDPQHPGGNLFVGGDQPAQPAYRTAKVMMLLGERYLIEVDGPGFALERPHLDAEGRTPRQGQPGDKAARNRMLPPERGVNVQLEPSDEEHPSGWRMVRVTAAARKAAEEAKRKAEEREDKGTGTDPKKP